MKGILILAIALVVVSFFAPISSSSTSIQWCTYNDGLNLAKEQNKPIMIHFTADWCGWCKKLDTETYTDNRVIGELDNFVCTKVDIDENKQIANRYNVAGIPTIVFIDVEEDEIHRIVGYRGPDEFLNEMLVVSPTPTPTFASTPALTPTSPAKESGAGFEIGFTFVWIIVAIYLLMKQEQRKG